MALKFYLDENVSERITDALRAKGYDATSANRLGTKGLGDGLQLLTAADLGRVLVTYDVVHFSLLHEARHAWSRAWNATAMARHRGILLIYGRKGDVAPEIAEAIHRFAKQLAPDDVEIRGAAAPGSGRASPPAPPPPRRHPLRLSPTRPSGEVKTIRGHLLSTVGDTDNRLFAWNRDEEWHEVR